MPSWDERYRAPGRVHGEEPSEFLAAYAWLYGPRANVASGPPRRALDLAMGEGRNAIYLAGLGFEVTGVDRSAVAVEKCRQWAAARHVRVEGVLADLESWPLPQAAYDLVVCINYLERSLLGAIRRTLRPGGWLVYETFTHAHLKYHPINPDYVLRAGELLAAFADFRLVVYREVEVPERKKGVASLIAQKEARALGSDPGQLGGTARTVS